MSLEELSFCRFYFVYKWKSRSATRYS